MNRLKSSDVLTKGPITPDWLVPDILCKGSMVVLAGDAGVGKSMLSYCLALALASGRAFLGKPLVADKVLYFDEENSRHDSDAYHRRCWLGLEQPPIELLDSNLCLLHFALNGHYAAEMRRAAELWKPALIIIDTANAACRIDDENDNAKASRAIKALREMQKASCREDCTVLILKHARVTHDRKGQDNYREIRGAKTWKSELDGVILHSAPVGRPPSHGKYRNTYLWPTKSRAFGLLQPLEIMPICSGEGVKFAAKVPE